MAATAVFHETQLVGEIQANHPFTPRNCRGVSKQASSLKAGWGRERRLGMSDRRTSYRS